MKKIDKDDDLSWKIFELWISIPKNARRAFLWSLILGVSYLGWIKIIRKLFE